MNTNHYRRTFLKKLARGLFTSLFTFGMLKKAQPAGRFFINLMDDSDIPRINPAFKMNLLADGTVELYTFQPEENKVSYQFKELEADVILKLTEKADPFSVINEFSKKYQITEQDCKVKVQSIMGSLKEKGIIYYGEQMMVKIMEEEDE